MISKALSRTGDFIPEHLDELVPDEGQVGGSLVGVSSGFELGGTGWVIGWNWLIFFELRLSLGGPGEIKGAGSHIPFKNIPY